MPDRRSLLVSAAGACGAALFMDHALAQDITEPTPKPAQGEDHSQRDHDAIRAAGLDEEEAECWAAVAAAAGSYFQLPTLHPMDQQEVASAIHIIQNKLLARPAYRKYLEQAKKGS